MELATKEQKGGYKRPQVLLLGNGINRAYAQSSVSWKSLIKNVGESGQWSEDFLLPMPLEIVLRTQDKIDNSLKEYAEYMYGNVDNPEMERILQHILSVGFDHIITTNYSYELEAAAESKQSLNQKQIVEKMKHTDEIKRAESKYMLHTYNMTEYQGHENRVWHIHGEARKPDSMILGHYYYGKLLYKYQELLHKRNNIYLKNQKEEKKQKIGSWIDAFILGDVYVLGFGFDFSEMDLWWLLNRKKREKADVGAVYFFSPEPIKDDGKMELLRVYGAKIEHCGYKEPSKIDGDFDDKERKKIQCDNNRIFREFYQAAVEEIERKVGRI